MRYVKGLITYDSRLICALLLFVRNGVDTMKKKIMINKTVSFTEEEARDNPLWCGFYELLSKKVGYDYEKVESIDCRDVEITPDLADLWQSEYEGTPNDFCCMMLIYGPKACMSESGYLATFNGSLVVSV